MKRNMLNKIADWIEKIKVWIYNKKPSNEDSPTYHFALQNA